MAKKKQQEQNAGEVDSLLDAHRKSMQPREREEFDEFFEAMTASERVEFVEGLAKQQIGDWSSKGNPRADIEKLNNQIMATEGVTVTQVEPKSHEEDPLMKPAEAARYLGVSPSTISVYIRGGLLAFAPFPGKGYRIRKSVLDRFAGNSCLVETKGWKKTDFKESE